MDEDHVPLLTELHHKPNGVQNGFAEFPPVRFTFKNIVYRVKTKKFLDSDEGLSQKGKSPTLLDKLMTIFCGKSYKKTILKNVSGCVESGELCAIMGASGAGKTTLLDVLASRNVSGKLFGEIKLNGHTAKSFPVPLSKITGYVMQDNLLHSTLTVRETIRFTAYLTSPKKMSRKLVNDKVEEIMHELGIHHIANSRIGGAKQRGISGGEMKRVSIALELISSPKLLFLDEPTSGLDSNTASKLMHTLNQLARNGRTIICTIHQPSSAMFRNFDKLLLLSDGFPLYFGPAQHAVEFFCEKLMIEEPKNTNPADFVLDLAFVAKSQAMSAENIQEEILTGEGPDDTFKDVFGEEVPTTKELVALFDESDIADNLIRDISHGAVPNSINHPSSGDDGFEKQNHQKIRQQHKQISKSYGAGFFMQLIILFHREGIHLIRHPQLCRAKIIQQILKGLIVGSVWWQKATKENSDSFIQDLTGALFITIALLAFMVFGDIPIYFEHRDILSRERANGLYHPFNYFISKVLINALFLASFVTIQSTCIYFMVGLRTDEWYYFFIFLGVTLLVAFVSEALVNFIANAFDSVLTAQVTGMLLIGIFFLFGGFYINGNTIPDYYSWAKYLSFLKYGFEALAINELQGQHFKNDIDGDDVIDSICEIPHLWIDVVALAGMFFFYHFCAYFCLHFFHREKR